MKDILNKTKLFYSKIIKKHEMYERRGIKPARDWSILLIINTTIFSLLVVFAFYLYMQVKNDTLFYLVKTNVLNEVKINTNLLKKTVNDINLREELTNNIKRNGAKFSDPSI